MRQSNKQSQSVKVVVNNRLCCEEKKKKRRRPRKETPKEGGNVPLEEIQMPLAPPMKDFARGLSAYPVRPSLYAPISQLIQPQSGLNQVPAYFEKQFTNQQATLDELKKQLDDIQNNSSLAIFSNPLFQSGVQEQGLAPARREGSDIPLPQASQSLQDSRQASQGIQDSRQATPDELRRDLARARELLGQYQSTDRENLPPKNQLKQQMNSIFNRHQIQTGRRYETMVNDLQTKVSDLPEETSDDIGFYLFD